MAKGLNLVAADIVEFGFIVNGDDADVKYLVAVYDDGGSLVNYESEQVKFSRLSTQIRAALNNAMRLLSKDANNSKVNENKETWVDK